MQLGNQKQRFRDGYRLALRLTCFLFPASKLVPFLLAGLTSKNTRSRVECLDELCHIVSETGCVQTRGRVCVAWGALLCGWFRPPVLFCP